MLRSRSVPAEKLTPFDRAVLNEIRRFVTEYDLEAETILIPSSVGSEAAALLSNRWGVLCLPSAPAEHFIGQSSHVLREDEAIRARLDSVDGDRDRGRYVLEKSWYGMGPWLAWGKREWFTDVNPADPCPYLYCQPRDVARALRGNEPFSTLHLVAIDGNGRSLNLPVVSRPRARFHE